MQWKFGILNKLVIIKYVYKVPTIDKNIFHEIHVFEWFAFSSIKYQTSVLNFTIGYYA